MESVQKVYMQVFKFCMRVFRTAFYNLVFDIVHNKADDFLVEASL